MVSRPQTPQDFLEWLIARFPKMTELWAGSYAVRADGSFTFHGVCMALTDLHLDHIDDYGTPQVAELFDLAERVIAADPRDADPFANALCTCFLENISATKAGEASIPLMGPASYRFFEGWHISPEERAAEKDKT